MLPQFPQFYTGPKNGNTSVKKRVEESIEQNSLPFVKILKEKFFATIHDFYEGDKNMDFKGIDCIISIFNFSNVSAALRVRKSAGTIGITVRKTEPKHITSNDCPRLILQHNMNTNQIFIVDAKIAYKLAKVIFDNKKPGVKNVYVGVNYRYYPQHNDSETYVELSEDMLKKHGALIASVQLHKPVAELDLDHLL